MISLQGEGLSFEREFLISAVRSAISGDRPLILSHSIDWELVMDHARYHGVVAQLWRTIGSPGSDGVPPCDVRQALHASFQYNVKRNLGLTCELWSITELLKGQGISAFPFKGPTLAILAYGNLALREFGDLDILVDKRDLISAGKLLKAAGYQPQMDVSVLRDPAFIAIEREFYFTHPETGTLIDVQWRLSSSVVPFNLETGHIAAHQITVQMGGREFITLGLEDLLLLLCVHGSRHSWRCLKWMADVAGLINVTPHLDWDLILAEARSLKCERILSHSLLLAQDLLGARVPHTIEQWAREDSGSRQLAAHISQTLAEVPGLRKSKLSLHQYLLKLQKRPADRFRYVMRMIFKPNVADWEFRPCRLR